MVEEEGAKVEVEEVVVIAPTVLGDIEAEVVDMARSPKVARCDLYEEEALLP